MLRRSNRAADGPADDLHRYQMRQKMVAIGDDFWIENAAGERVFKVDGKAVRVRETLNFEDAQGNVLCKIQERKLRVRDSMAVDDAAGEQVAEVHKALISPIRDRFEVQLKDGPDLEVKGNIVDHEYTIGEGRDKVAQVSKKWFRIRDSYGVEIEPGQDDVVILAITVCIDQIAHSGK
ncbi:MAG: LURP-one-related family protein [Chloroflexota bacterium]|jgi:uncharacterized protein YxjI